MRPRVEEEVGETWKEVRDGGGTGCADELEDKGEVVNEEGEEEGGDEEEEGDAGVPEGEKLLLVIPITAATAAAAVGVGP